MPDHPYYRAARAADAAMGEHGDLPDWAAQYGVELEPLVMLAQQRALRGVMTTFMGFDPEDLNLSLDELRLIEVPEWYLTLIPVFAALYIDGWANNLHYNLGGE